MNITLLTLNEIKQCINMKQAIDVMEIAFKQLINKEVVLPLRTPVAVAKEGALSLTMPGYLERQEALGVKLVSIFPNNLHKAKPAINGAIVLLDAKSGETLAMMEAAYLTALRTGAVSGLASKYLAREDAEHLAIIGSGTQALTQLEAVRAVRDIKRVSVWSRNKENAQAFARSLDSSLESKAYDDISDAVKEADIICTATGSTQPLLYLKDLKPGVHINAIGSHSTEMCELANDVMAHSIVVADQLEAVLAESGEIVSAIKNKMLEQSAIRELGEVILTANEADKQEITVFKSVGLAIQDISIAQVVYQNALQKQLGVNFALS
ncbi:ornithine cyclodeaminase [Legionella massiliensis]|uniref:Ornithine cyclodeaminase n=1 Tax=Legionella massiliensis TaxID=1034943 RepID=A0A078L421_9GAMM|nr:Gfo/Idh/MocA family oxidoreductase [Legionella massiliensis]CDZ78688.1 ornithine cyclodeaminase [Legionella massiliensis]CEE14426.1 L-lysine cyclodeaminase [Legionella massiliensis]